MHRTKLLFSIVPNATTRQTTETVGETVMNGFKTVTKTFTEMSWSKMSTTRKMIIGGYFTGMVTYGLTASYNGGKTDLLEFRNKKTHAKYNSEWDAVYGGCTKNVCGVFWESLFWPTGICSQIVPHAVLYFNPEEPPAPQKPQTPTPQKLK